MEKYNKRSQDGDDSSSNGDYENTAFLNSQYVKEDRRRKQMMWLTFFNLFIFTISAMTLICAVFSQRSTSGHAAAKLMDQFSTFSPAMHVVEYERVKMELPSPLNSSKYVGLSQEVEDAWMDLAYQPDQMVSMDDFPKLQKPADSLMVTDPKTGETGYRVGLEVFHQLRCLNTLRMAAYGDYTPGSDGPESELDECVEMLRMNLMCLSDISVFTFRAQPGLDGAKPDYESQHVCRNFDKIKDWANENAMPTLEEM